MSAKSEFLPLSLCVLTVSDSRTAENDTSGDFLCAALSEAGHRLHARAISKDDRYKLRAIVSNWIAEADINGILVTGGTGFTGRDSTPEAIRPLLDKEMPGFGEMFRVLSFDEIGTSTLQSRAFAGLANDKFIFCLPGSTSACKTAWEKLLRDQLDSHTRPCNLAGLLPRISKRSPSSWSNSSAG
jgi:molybdenum cofactor biosynthesis protein B